MYKNNIKIYSLENSIIINIDIKLLLISVMLIFNYIITELSI